MLSFILSYLWKSAPEEKLSLDEAYEIVRKDEDGKVCDKIEAETEEIGNYETYVKVGRITSASDEWFTIDDTYKFKSDLYNLGVGSKISYQLIKTFDSIHVANVDIIENDWNVVITGKRKWCSRTIVCQVIERNYRKLLLSPGDVTLDLNKIAADFIPIVGDWVELDVKCEIDENVTDLTGKLIEVQKVLPLRLHVMQGNISKWDAIDKVGTINRNIFFNQSALTSGYIPLVGDEVVAELFESEQGLCCWRSIKIIPSYLHSTSVNELSTSLTEDFIEEYEGVTITKCIEANFNKLGESTLLTVEISNEATKEFLLLNIELPKRNQCRMLHQIVDVSLKSKTTLPVQIECIAKCIGDSREPLLFHFENFKIRRWIDIKVALTKTSFHRSKKTYHSNKYNEATLEQRESVRGQSIKCSRFQSVRIPDYRVPQRLLQLILNPENQWASLDDLKCALEQMKPVLINESTYFNYEDRYHSLLHLEEISVIMAMRNYDQDRACFIRCGEYLLLEIENLSERRPSIIAGDKVVARNIFDERRPDFEGIVHRVGLKHVYLKFSSVFQDTYNDEDYAIKIVASRTTFRRQHYALGLAVRHLGKEFLFPTRVVEKEEQINVVYDDCSPSSINETPEKSKISRNEVLKTIKKIRNRKNTIKLDWYNDQLNYFQKEAVKNILLGTCRPLPYIVFGPPGTGKTVTLIEAILQILRLIPHSRLLVAAPSNSAANLLAIRLIDSGVLKPGDLVRLVSFTSIKLLPAKLAPYSATGNIEKEGTETDGPMLTNSGLVLGASSSVLGRHRITVCTSSTAGLLFNMGFSRGHFTHIVVDEAAQTAESSVMIPLSFLDVNSGQAILAGDPMQLGPVVLSTWASKYGLGQSFLERIINRFPYVRDANGFPDSNGYDPRLVTKLILNYRSLPLLLRLPSLLFYHDELIATLKDDSSEADMLRSLKEMLPILSDNNGVPPMVFHGVIGENRQHEDSPSWFNPDEAAQVFYYVNELYRLGRKGDDIGIITPYKSQSQHLMALFNEAEFQIPKIGTIEEFQGQEFNIIILSTVRSSGNHFENDFQQHGLKFLLSPRRLNVAMTRAKVLLIIVGNPQILYSDRHWRSVIDFCVESGFYTGCEILNK